MAGKAFSIGATSPAELIQAVRLRRGDDPGPPAGIVLENPLQLDPLGDDEVQGPDPLPPGARTLPVVQVPEQLGEGVSLTHRDGYFMGHALSLNDQEAKALTELLAKVVKRQLREELKRIGGG